MRASSATQWSRVQPVSGDSCWSSAGKELGLIGLAEGGDDFAGQQLELLQDVLVRHAGKVQPADEVIDPEGVGKAPDGQDAVLRVADDKAVLPQGLELVHRGLVLRAD